MLPTPRIVPALAIAVLLLTALPLAQVFPPSGLGRDVAVAQQSDDPTLTLQARLCPDGYDDVAFAADCDEPLADFLFDIAGPTNAEEATDDDGLADIGQTPPGDYAIEALDYDADDGFVVRCERPVDGERLPVDIAYTDAGFDIELEEPPARAVPEASDPASGVTCTWYSVPGGATDERTGIVEVTGRRCPAADEDPVIVALSPGGEADDVTETLAECDSVDAAVTLVNEETEAETPVEAEATTEDEGEDEDGPDAPYTAVGVPAGRYTVTREGAEPIEAFTVDAGEATLVVVEVPAPTLEVSLRPGPTATLPAPTATPPPVPTATAEPPPAPEPTAPPEPTAAPAPAPLAAIAFGPGDWQGGFANIDTGVYGRAAVAVYGSFSPYPSATLGFSLPNAPAGGASLFIEGLADELGPAQIAIVVNGVEVYRGDSGFFSWDPSAASPAWTAAGYAIPAGVLQSGPNTITVANLAASGAFGVPPYVLLSVATLSFEG